MIVFGEKAREPFVLPTLITHTFCEPGAPDCRGAAIPVAVAFAPIPPKFTVKVVPGRTPVPMSVAPGGRTPGVIPAATGGPVLMLIGARGCAGCFAKVWGSAASSEEAANRNDLDIVGLGLENYGVQKNQDEKRLARLK